MYSSFFHGILVAVAIGFYTLLGILLLMVYRKFRFHQENKTIPSPLSPTSPSSSSSSCNSKQQLFYRKFRFHQENKTIPSPLSPTSPSSSSSSCNSKVQLFYRKFGFPQENKTIPSPLSPTSPSSSCNWKHQVFPSFHGPDVRETFLSHIMKAFKSKAIDVFIDNDIKKGESIGPELREAIRGSRIAIVFLSSNYASSSWCLDELMEIIKCREESGQKVMTLFYGVEPTDVKKQTGDFGTAFKKTCKGKTEEVIGRWRLALAKVATIAGYHSSKWDNEAAMIEKITNDISNKLNISTPSNDFTSLVGMEAHMEKMELRLRLENTDEVKMIGICGPFGIGKTTIARFLFSKHSESFDLSVFMEDVKGYTRPGWSDEHGLKMHLQQQFLSQIFKQKDIQVPHLGVAQDRLKDKKMLVVLDDVDRAIQLDAMAKETKWFGPGSRIIITTQDKRLLKAHGIKDIYMVNFPSPDEAYQIFCMNAFGENTPKDGFEVLAWYAIYLDGIHPLGISRTGYKLRGLSKEEWTGFIPKLKWTDALILVWINPETNIISNLLIGNRINNEKHKGLSHISSRMKNYQVKIAAAARTYEINVKDFDEKKKE